MARVFVFDVDEALIHPGTLDPPSRRAFDIEIPQVRLVATEA